MNATSAEPVSIAPSDSPVSSFSSDSKRKRIEPRAPRLALEGVPRHWFANSRAATQLANGINLLFPSGERFFIRSVRHYLDRVSPDLAAQVKGFFGQEGRHAQTHERVFDTMRAQGLDIDSILERYEHLAYDIIEKSVPKKLSLAVTVALEHYTALLAEDALEADGLAHAHPEMRRLLEWHAVEELEHKAVAFDVLSEIDRSYLLRIAGLVVATLTLGGFWVWATHELLKQDGSSLWQMAGDLRRLRKKAAQRGDKQVMGRTASSMFLRGMRAYIKPGFHPNDRDHSELIATTLARLEREGVVAQESAKTETPEEVTS
jgi:uncharacterized protein